MITTLVDYYGYPSDAPQCSCSGMHLQPACVEAREQAIQATLPSDQRFVPFIALYEFETLVIAAGAGAADVLGNAEASKAFKRIVNENDGDAERINNSPATAPSKRVAETIEGYSKVRDGVAIIENVLDSALIYTPRFDAWISLLKAVENV